jgi:hypothetical protein
VSAYICEVARISNMILNIGWIVALTYDIQSLNDYLSNSKIGKHQPMATNFPISIDALIVLVQGEKKYWWTMACGRFEREKYIKFI